MSSPFPGMDPFIEACGLWGDFHDKLVGEIERELSRRLPARYVARIRERTYVEWIDPREIFLEIQELDPQRRLVTCIEVLSPSNKRFGSAGWLQYDRKRQVFLEGHANLVEIDLLRGGRRRGMEEPWPGSPYYVLALRKSESPACQVWPAHMDRPLPEITIPLVPPDADLRMCLLQLFKLFLRGRYGHTRSP